MRTAILIVFTLSFFGCGSPTHVSPPVPTPPPAPTMVDVPAFLFSTNARDIVVTVITDTYDLATGLIQRIAHPNNGSIDARDHYAVNKTLGCIEVWSVDTYQYDPDKTWLRYQQIYPTHPCWVGALTYTIGQDPVVSRAVNGAPYSWRQFDKSGAQIGADFTAGKWDDHTTLTCTVTGNSAKCLLTEFYEDLTSGNPVEDPYCIQGTYDQLGLAKLSPGSCP